MAWTLSTKEIETLHKTSVDEGLTDEQIIANKIQHGNNFYPPDIESLSPSKQYRALRNKSLQNISLREIVVGDVILLSAGDICPADCVIVSTDNPITIDMSNFTGEIDPVARSSEVDPNASVEAAPNVIYASVPIVTGDCKIIVFAVGSKTMLGTALANTKRPVAKKPTIKEARLVSKLLQFNFLARNFECLSAIPKITKIVVFEPSVANTTNLQRFNQHAIKLGIQLIVCTSLNSDSDDVKKFVEAFQAPETIFTQDNAGTLQRIKCGMSPNDKLSEVQDKEGICSVGSSSPDASAIYSSYLSICLGISGTEVAKEAADMILLSDNLNDILNAIEYSKNQSGCCVL